MALSPVIKIVLRTELLGLNRLQNVLVAYANKNNKKAAKNIGFTIDENQTNFMIESRRERPQNILSIENLFFERVYNFKRSRVDVNSQTNSHGETHKRIAANNKSVLLFVN